MDIALFMSYFAHWLKENELFVARMVSQFLPPAAAATIRKGAQASVRYDQQHKFTSTPLYASPRISDIHIDSYLAHSVYQDGNEEV
jgi:hypothetical protein